MLCENCQVKPGVDSIMDPVLIEFVHCVIRSEVEAIRFGDVADDVAQDYIVELLQKPWRSRVKLLLGAREIFASGRIPRWLRPELRRRAVKLRKKAARHRGVSLDPQDERISLPSIAYARRREQAQVWVDELRSMPKHREIVDAVLHGGCQTKQEVADRLGVTVRTVYNWASD